MTAAAATNRPTIAYTRQFCPEGVNPEDTLEWGRRDAIIRDTNGDIVFEQLGVNFPTSWLDTSVKVVASKE